MACRRLTRLLMPCALLAMTALPLYLTGCGNNDGGTEGRVTWDMVRDGAVTRTHPETGVEWTILGIRTDSADRSRAKQNAEDALANHPDMAGMVGLWAYNPPAILQAVEGRGLLDQVTIVGFDEDPVTLDAIGSGKIAGTVVQNPYEFGFRSVEYLSAAIRDQPIDVPDNGLMFIPTRKITRENVGAFQSLTESIRAGEGPTPEYDASKYDTAEAVSIHFVTNVDDPFWKLAESGCDLAGEKFNADVVFYIPPNGQVTEQKTHVESMIVNDVDGLAISVKEPEGQTRDLNKWCEQMKVITVDSDAPASDRLFYLGTDNVAAGRKAGELLAQANPEGGKVMIFVGMLTQANARERAQGVIDALFGQ